MGQGKQLRLEESGLPKVTELISVMQIHLVPGPPGAQRGRGRPRGNQGWGMGAIRCSQVSLRPGWLPKDAPLVGSGSDSAASLPAVARPGSV